MANNTFSILFFIKKNKVDKNGDAPIYGRITVNGERAEFSASRRINPKKWKTGRVVGTTSEAKALQNHLVALKSRILQIHTELINEGKPITSKILKDRIQINPRKGKTLIQTFEYYKKQLFELGQKSTHKKYVTIQRHVEEYLKLFFKKSDIPLRDLDYQFIAEFVHYLKSSCGISHNTTRRYMKQVKSIVHVAEKNDWIDKDPFKKFRMREEPIQRTVLTETELKQIEEKEIANIRLNEVKDIFLFCCYTGLAFVDMEKLSNEHIQILPDGKKMIFIHRSKTEVKSSIYLSNKAQQIINKYKDHPLVQEKGTVLPVKSAQKYNAYLKEIQVICEIDKTLTSHVARRTNGTLLLNNGVRLEVVQQSLGHRRIEQTKEYAKLLNQTVADEVSKLDGKI
jgi:site-specific recombinase XerD